MRPGEPLILWDWTFSHLPDIARRVQEHLILTGIAVGLGLVIAFALSLAIRQIPALYAPVTWLTGVLYSIPSLALFSLLIPFTGLSITTAEIGLVSYTLLILVRNIVGALVYVGSGRQPPAWVAELLGARDRKRAAPTFAASGLYLTGVDYAPRWNLPPTWAPVRLPRY